MSFLHDTLNT